MPTWTWSRRRCATRIGDRAGRYHPTETTRFADVLFPAAQWPEKDGVMTNSERRLTYLPKLVDPPGEALPDAVIITRFAREMGWGEAFPSERAADIFDEFAALTAGTACDYSGVSHARLRAEGPLQWPVPAPDHPGTERLYTDGRFATASGRAHFIAVEHDPPVELPDGDYPLTLTTGRVRDHMAYAHTNRQVAASDAAHAGPCSRSISTTPGARGSAMGLRGDHIEEGKVVAQTRVSERIREGTCFCPSTGGAPRLLQGRQQPDAGRAGPAVKQPELKCCARPPPPITPSPPSRPCPSGPSRVGP